MLYVLLILAPILSNLQHVEGDASYYSLSGNTASGEKYDKYALTCATPDIQFNTYCLVLHQHNLKWYWIVCRVNDRGPYIKKRIIDVSLTCAEHLRLKDKGVGHVHCLYFNKIN